MAKSVKLSDIAAKLGVSNVTVSKALADKSGVSEEKRQQIKALAAEMGYIPISAAKSKSETGNIGILIPNHFVEKNTSFYWAMYQQVVNQLTEQKRYAILELLKYGDEKSLNLPQMVQDGKVDGLIVLGQISKAYSEFIWNVCRVPVIYVDFYDSHADYDAVVSDGFYGMYVMTDYMIRMGHERIGFVGTVLSTSSITDRYFGFRKAMMESGFEVQPEWIIPDREMETGDFVELVLPKELPTAFACNNDLVANSLINKLTELGVKVPEDVSVCGFDNYLYPNLTDVHMTSYEVRMDRMAQVCVKTLLGKIAGEDYIKGIQVITGNLVIRDTVKHI